MDGSAKPAPAKLDPRKFIDPILTFAGEHRASVALEALSTLWLNTGTLCNLTCRNCYIESSPKNDRLSYLTLDEVRGFLDGHDDPEVYFHNPLAYVPRLEGEALERVRANTHLTLVCGQGMYEEGCIEETLMLGDLLAAKHIPHDRDIWGPDVKHDWVWWRRQAVHHMGRRYGS